MSRTRLTLLAGASGLSLILAGCEGDFSLKPTPGAEASAAAARPAADRVVERDIEAPDIFQKTESGLWDGRPSLGGVWVAHPDVADPERVIIRNESNGKFVIGALFRRERDNPGPSLQVSSDAAAALDLVAGQPTTLNVTALRRNEEEAETAPEDLAATGSDAPVTDVAEARTIETPEEIAAAPLGPANAAPAGPVAADPGETPPEAAAETAASDAKEKRRGGFLSGLFAPRPSRDPGNALIPEAIAEPAAAGTEIAPPQPVAAAPAAFEPNEAPRAETRAAPSGTYLQIGLFSVEDNARRTADLLRRNGVVPTISERSSNGKTYWRVTAGPARNASDTAALKRKVGGLGFKDAFAVNG